MFEVQTYTIFDGWVNCWTDAVDGVEVPTTFEFYEDALVAVDEITEFNQSARCSRNDYRIMEITRGY